MTYRNVALAAISREIDATAGSAPLMQATMAYVPGRRKLAGASRAAGLLSRHVR